MAVKYYKELEQGTPEWYKARCGVLTASEIVKIITPKLAIANNDKTRALVYEKVAERVHGHTEDAPHTFAMQRGNIEELYSIELYNKHYGQAEACGFITNDKWGFTIGASPDGLVGNDGGIETKGRKQSIQTKVFIEGGVPEYDMLQVQTSLLVSERKWWDYLSYSNGKPQFIMRVEPNPVYFEKITEAATLFEEAVNKNMAIYKEAIKGKPVAEYVDYFEDGEINPSDNF